VYTWSIFYNDGCEKNLRVRMVIDGGGVEGIVEVSVVMGSSSSWGWCAPRAMMGLIVFRGRLRSRPPRSTADDGGENPWRWQWRWVCRMRAKAVTRVTSSTSPPLTRSHLLLVDVPHRSTAIHPEPTELPL